MKGRAEVRVFKGRYNQVVVLEGNNGEFSRRKVEESVKE